MVPIQVKGLQRMDLKLCLKVTMKWAVLSMAMEKLKGNALKMLLKICQHTPFCVAV